MDAKVEQSVYRQRMVGGRELMHRWMGRLLAGLWVGICLQGGTASALTPLERDLKKVARYLNDGFCDDALRLATELSKSKEGEKSFEVLFSIARAQHCISDIPNALATVENIRKVVNMDSAQEGELNTFARDKIELSFGELRLALPGGKSGTVELQLEKVGALQNANLDNVYQDVKKKLAAGVLLPGKVYLPFGTYEIDQVERSIEDFRGITYVVGKEKLSLWKRSQVGDGQLLGVGWMAWSGFEGDELVIEQPEGGEQVLVTGSRLSFSSTPFLELSTTHSTRLGTMGMVGARLDLRARPAVNLVGVGTGEDGSSLTPSYYSGGLSIHLAVPGPAGVNVNAGLGARFSTMSYMRYIAVLRVPQDTGGFRPVQAGIDLTTLGVGPELSIGAGRAFRAGKTGIQVGVELQGGVTVVFPARSTGTVVIQDEKGKPIGVEYEVSEETLWGPHIGAMFFIRVPMI